MLRRTDAIYRVSHKITMQLQCNCYAIAFCNIRDAINRRLYVRENHILRLYCPPTSNNADVICPNEQTFVDSINLSNKFSFLIAEFCKMAICWATLSALDACKLANMSIWYCFSVSVARITSAGTTVGEPLELKKVFTPIIGNSPLCFNVS